VTEFTVTGVADDKDLKTSLPKLLVSRLRSELVYLVKNQALADQVVSGSYILSGRLFSLDAQIVQQKTSEIATVFEQGEGQDDLIPAVGRLAQKINRELEKISTVSGAKAALVQPLATALKPLPAVTENAGSRNDGTVRLPEQIWASKPIDGVLLGIALGRTLPGGDRELFAAGEQTVRYYHQGKELKLVGEVVLQGAARILAIDTADLDQDGVPEIYVTILDRDTLASQVFLPKEGGLEKIAGNLPLFFRGIGNELKYRIMLAQKIGVRGDFYGKILELVKSGSRFETKNSDKFPDNASIFNVSRISDSSGNLLHLVLNEDGKIVVVSKDGSVVWKSGDTYGGSETGFRREIVEEKRNIIDQNRAIFLEQRMLVTPGGDVLVPLNKGMFNVGDYRSYAKHSIFALHWDGSVLQEKWHTSDTPSYLADFTYDPLTNELILLKVVQKEGGIWGKGKSLVSILKEVGSNK
jgi:hypothetical protein